MLCYTPYFRNFAVSKSNQTDREMILFFNARGGDVIAVEAESELSDKEKGALRWLFGAENDCTAEPRTSVLGTFIGPRREMVTPWSTNAVEITQNMNIIGISRIERFTPCNTPPEAGIEGLFDPMLQRIYEGLDQDVFAVSIEPEPIHLISDIEDYNEREGLALSAEEIDYLLGIEKQIGRRLTDSEIFGFAQINSEHCRHKIFGGTFIIDGKEMPTSLFSMIKQTTHEHPHKIVSAYKDNVAFAQGPIVEQFAPADQSTSDWFRVKDIESVISLKAETHNFPTTVEPFNGAATGTGGEIRDRMGGGTGSWPIAGTAVYMTAYPRPDDETTAPASGNAGTQSTETDLSQTQDESAALRNIPVRDWESTLAERQWLYQTPEQILIKASNGASDFGNKFGQPLICGSVLTFEHSEGSEKYAYDKVIMLAGGVGYGTRRDCLKKEPKKGNKIVVVGGDNYRIGLGGGSVSSVDTGRYASGIELNAVQRANPEMQKRAYNLIRALCEEEVNPVVSIHDHGSAGHVNCLSELVEQCGGEIDMASLPIGDKTLSSKEIIANESQERMGLLIDEKHIEHVRRIAERERAPLYVVGETTGDAHFSFRQADGVKPFDLDVAQMFGHSPKTYMTDETVERHYSSVKEVLKEMQHGPAVVQNLLERVLQLEAVACKDWLTNKVDRSVTGKIARQQCQGPLQLPLSDCGVVALDYRGRQGIATALGHAPQAGLASAEAGSVLSVAEALTNIVWAPLADGLDSVSLSANWMWPCRSQKGEDARLYRAVKALSDFCRALHVNVPTGKDSLSMSQQYPDGEKIIAPGTVIVSSGAEVSDIRKAVSPVVVNEFGAHIYYIDFSKDELKLGGSALAQSLNKVGDDVPTVKGPQYFALAFNAVQGLVNKGMIAAGHDISAGGMITTLLEMCFANETGGLDITLDDENKGIETVLFAENPGVVVEVRAADAAAFADYMSRQGVGYKQIGTVNTCGRELNIVCGDTKQVIDIDRMRDIWYKTSYLLDRKQSFNGCAEKRYRNYKHQPVEISFDESIFNRYAESATPVAFPYRSAAERRSPSGIRAAIIREKGTNGDREMAYSLYLAGFDVKDVMMTDLISGRETLDDINMIVFCGGFSNSDVLGSAKGWAGAFLYNPKAKEALDRYYERKDTLSLGICNGCQLMVELGLIGGAQATMEHNISHKFESSFLGVTIPENKSVMLSSLAGSKLGIWVAHGEGRFSLPEAEANYNIVARYSHADYPGNPNGSDYSVAGICSADGRHLAMMPHLERAIFPWQCAWYPAEHRKDDVTPWIEAFVNAKEWVKRATKQEI